jgi:hypothetical protein
MTSANHLLGLMITWKRKYGLQKKDKRRFIEDMAIANIGLLKNFGFESRKEIDELIQAIKRRIEPVKKIEVVDGTAQE